MPEWALKLAKRIASLTPEQEWLILIRIEKGKRGAAWIVEELGKVEQAVERLRK